ncbi:single-strand selective monofunctional uracil DNA glycosylase-like isoform X1 [Watersipora subatra]|uniref:single-strand selective monofunctional uracil DNA glycosylase-like isoform X1 n=1 Tax=Watersipora subatra TaxID=2589382 RepID=UPI00355BEC6C
MAQGGGEPKYLPPEWKDIINESFPAPFHSNPPSQEMLYSQRPQTTIKSEKFTTCLKKESDSPESVGEPSIVGVCSAIPCYKLNIRIEAITAMQHFNALAAKLLVIETLLAEELVKLDFGPKVTHVYNPIDYAYKPHLEYYRKFCYPSTEVVMIGMNPGPYGMSQTGVPFGEVKAVTEWLTIAEAVGSPSKVHAKRPVLGFDCERSEVSGGRIWSFLQKNFATPQDFFNKCFLFNYCPIALMEKSGKNITPAQLPAQVKRTLTALCDEALLQSILLFPNCKSLVGIGRFAEERIKAVCKAGELQHQQKYLLHPSPQNPDANKNWNSRAQKAFEDLGLLSPLPVTNNALVAPLSRDAVKRNLFSCND